MTIKRGNRKRLTPKERTQLWSRQLGRCACGCGEPLSEREGTVGEHFWFVCLGNSEKPDALFRRPCALRKTNGPRGDLNAIGRIKRHANQNTQADKRASPDQLVDDDGLLEIKCPATHTHIEALLGAEIDPDYVKQMHWQMACTGRQWCDFVSYDPRLPEDMRMHRRRLERNDLVIRELETAVEIFLAEVDDTIKRLRRTYAEAA